MTVLYSAIENKIVLEVEVRLRHTNQIWGSPSK